jgi:hypothetical protein
LEMIERREAIQMAPAGSFESSEVAESRDVTMDKVSRLRKRADVGRASAARYTC